MDFRDSDLRSNLLRNFIIISGQHNKIAHTGCFQFLHCFRSMWLDHIRDQDMSGICAVDCKMHDRSDAVAVTVFDGKLLHQLIISSCNLMSVNRCDHTVSANLLYIRHTCLIQFLTICFLQTDADRMRAVTLCQSRILKDMFFLRCVLRLASSVLAILLGTIMLMDTTDLKYALCDGSCLIKYNRLRLRKCLHIIGPLDQNAL